MLTIAFVASALCALSAASPTAPAKRTVTIPMVRRSAPSSSGTADMADLEAQANALVLKYESGIYAYAQTTGADPPFSPSFARRAATERAYASEELTGAHSGALWQGLVTVGTPTQTFTVSFDTGFGDVVLPGTACNTCKGRLQYNPVASTSAVDRREAFKWMSPDGSMSGRVYGDSVGIAGLEVRNQTLAVASAYTPDFSTALLPADGVLGLAFPSVSRLGTPSFLQSLVDQHQIASPIFAFKLADAGAELTLGGANSALYTDKFTYVPVQTASFWNVRLDGVSLNGTLAVGGRASMLDTGTALLLAPADDAHALYGALPGARPQRTPAGDTLYMFPCAGAPTLGLVFNGKAFKVPRASFSLGGVQEREGVCVGAVAGSERVAFWVVGTTFLQTVYTEFDVGKSRIGFAALK
ncbi:Asp-domain-containing protein [Phanerochaete sordida]|uniref:Asp-domain-containing protein n=1 Tax=Phanerochaete sordida TaxID=48140 RepID=A0A9P3G8Q6_9APHY|nr:Asp-domain-containing protein [Phanerochaete sordida]